MWIILPEGRVINFARPIRINDVMHPAAIFRSWTLAELAAIGIYEYVEHKFDSHYYRSTGSTLELIDSRQHRTYTIEPRYAVNELKLILNKVVKSELYQLYRNMKKQLDFLNEFSPADSNVAVLEQYKANLKVAYVNIRSDVLGLSNYEALVNFDWKIYYPEAPVID